MKRRVERLEAQQQIRKFPMVVVVNNHKPGEPLPDNVGPFTTVINLIDTIKEGELKNEKKNRKAGSQARRIPKGNCDN